MSSQVPVWFWRRMSRLVADQENRGGAGDSGAGEKESVMRMNLAEGCEAVNAAPWRAEREARVPAGFSCLFGLSGLFG